MADRSQLPGAGRVEEAAEGVGVERVVTIERRSYSRAPWRLIDSLTGKEVSFPIEFDHPNIGKTVIQQAGFDTKQKAIAGLGRLAATALPLAYCPTSLTGHPSGCRCR